MKKCCLILFFGLMANFCFAQGRSVYPLKAFKKKYTNATDAKWMRKNGTFQVLFSIKETPQEAIFSLDGQWVQTRTFWTTQILGSHLEAVIQKKLPGCIIEEVIEIATPQLLYYEVFIIDRHNNYLTLNITRLGLILDL